VESICAPHVPHVSTTETERTPPEIGMPGLSRYVEVLCGNYSGGHEYSTMASEKKLGASEREVVGESRSLLCDEVGMRVAVTG
jgi:hypothetical protein